MAIKERERLRQLVSDYYHGLVTDESYREQRALLLDNLGKETGDVSEDTATRPRREEREDDLPSPGSAEPEATSFNIRYLAIAVVVLAGMAVVAYVILQRPSDTDGPTPVAGDEIVRSPFMLGRGDALVDEFLSTNDWTDESLGNFVLAWEALATSQREEAVGGRHYRSLTTRLHQRIREERALGAGTQNGNLAALTEFAEAIGAPFRQSRVPTPDTSPDVAPVQVTEPAGAEPEQSIDDATFEDTAMVVPDVTDAPVTEESVESVEPDDATRETQAAEQDVAEPITEDPAADPIDDPCEASLVMTRRPYCRDALADGSKGPALVVLPAGGFRMGDDRFDSESPAHEVNIDYHIAMSRFEVTAEEFERFCRATSLLCAEQRWNDDSPVVSVSWDDAVLYTQWLSEVTGFTYRLPSEAEWEFAARAGTETPYFFGDEITPSAAHSSENGEWDSPVPTGDRSVNRNAFKLYHMSGNVREWVQDAWHPNYEGAPTDGASRSDGDKKRRVVRGGSYRDDGTRLRSAAREPLEHSHRDEVTGIRIVREVTR